MRKIGTIILHTLPYLFVFLANIFQPTDGDLGWHLKYGEYFFKHFTPLYSNIYSTMMPGYYWPNSSWITDLLAYSLFKLGSFIGLSLASAGIVTLTFYFISKTFKLKLLAQAILFPILVLLLNPINSVSFRGQQISLLLMSILLYLLESKDQYVFKTKMKRFFLIPFLFLLWINTHGEFLLGFGVLALYAVGNIIEALWSNHNLQVSIRNIFHTVKPWSFIILASLFATLFDPFGISIYKEAFTHVGNADLKYIAEYVPFADLSADWRNAILVFCLLAFASCIFFFQDVLHKKISIILTVFSLFVLCLTVKRFAWPFYYVTPGVLTAYFDLQKKENKISKTIVAIIIMFAIGVTLFTNNPLKTLRNASWSALCKDYISCSPKSADFLVKHPTSPPLWTNYNWGGYLIWNYPKIKPSIDGRMHLWKDEKGYSAFDEYYPVEQAEISMDRTSYNSAYVWDEKPVYKKMLELVSEGKWTRIYDDGVASIFTRNQSAF